MVNKSNKQPIKIENSDIGILQFCLKVLYERENDELAWRLVERFGSVSGIFSASHEELMQMDGVTDPWRPFLPSCARFGAKPSSAR